MNYDAELKRYFEVAWAAYKQKNPTANQMTWYSQNAGSLKSYFDALFAQKQAQAAAQPQPTAPAPAPTQQPSQSQQQAAGITPTQLMQVDQAIKNIIADQAAKGYTVSRQDAERILSGSMARPSDGTYTPQSPTGLPSNMPLKGGYDWATLDETTRANKAAEDMARQRLDYERGVAVGKVGGTNTLDSVKYSNEILANPANAALSEQIRKGYAMGDMPGQTVASYLNRSVDGKQMPGHMGGGMQELPGFAKGVYGFSNAEEAMAMRDAMQQFEAAGKDPQEFIRIISYINAARDNKPNQGPPAVDRSTESNNGFDLGNPGNYGSLYETMTEGWDIDTAGNREWLAERTRQRIEENREALAAAARGGTDVAKKVGSWVTGHEDGGQKVIGGEPHWIVNNSGNPVAALTEDGKPEVVKGAKHGVEVVPLDPARKAAYMARKNTPGMGTSQRTAPSRRPGGQQTNAISKNRAKLPNGAMAAKKSPNTNNMRGKVNNGRPAMPGDRMPGQTSQREVAGMFPAANALANRIDQRGPMPVMVNPGGRPGMGFPMVMGAAKGGFMGKMAFGGKSIGKFGPMTLGDFSARLKAAPGLRRENLQALNKASGMNREKWMKPTAPQPTAPQPVVGQPVAQPPVRPIATAPINPVAESDMRYRILPYQPRPVTYNPEQLQALQHQQIQGRADGGPVTFIGSGGARIIGNNVQGPKFGFARTAQSDIAGRNRLMGVKNNPGVFVDSANKWQPRALKTMTTADRAMLESYIRGTGQDPASFWNQAGFAEPVAATSRRQFY